MPLESTPCLFCSIAVGQAEAFRVWEDENCLVFLDHRPLFAGHCLVIPKRHYETLPDLPIAEVAPFFLSVRFLTAAVEKAMDAEGTFVAINNRVSQSVPHLHVHVVPRRRGDGLRGFFWPRHAYADRDEMSATVDRLQAAIRDVLTREGRA
jgi:histidine triad (HIT) family protein